MTSVAQTSVGLLSAIGWITLVAICGAVAGVALTSRAAFLSELVPFVSGLMLGMALFLLLPEALSSTETLTALGLCAGGCLLFGLMEATLHGMSASPHSRMLGMIPLILAVGFHSLLDGWNIATALALPSERLVWAFLIGMSVHKLSGGVAIGAIFRSAAPRLSHAYLWAAVCESLTVLGALLQFFSSRSLGTQWTIWLIGLTAGSFLYLGCHAFQTARAKSGFRSAAVPAGLGIASIWMISMAR